MATVHDSTWQYMSWQYMTWQDLTSQSSSAWIIEMSELQFSCGTPWLSWLKLFERNELFAEADPEGADVMLHSIGSPTKILPFGASTLEAHSYIFEKLLRHIGQVLCVWDQTMMQWKWYSCKQPLILAGFWISPKQMAHLLSVAVEMSSPGLENADETSNLVGGDLKANLSRK